MTSTFIVMTTVVAGAIALTAGYLALSDLLFRDRSRIRERLRASFAKTVSGSGSRESPLGNLSSLAEHTQLRRLGPIAWASTVIEQSAINVTLYQAATVSLIIGVVASCIAVVLTGNWAFLGVGLPAAAALPLIIYLRRGRRSDQLVAQLPDAFDVMSRSLKAGQTIIGAMDIIARDARGPLSEEFRRCRDQLNLGLSQEAALRDLARRTGVIELQMLVVSLLVQRQSGGNLVEILNNLAIVVRKRLQLRAKVKALTGEGRMQAVVLIILPAVMFGAILVINRDYAQELLKRPGLLGVVIASQSVGSLWIRRIINFDY